jgi:membrane-associated phospholipid phosphatase/4-amino-4-deoxy-L-arabinose transferase-like glycosyltransferase
VLWFQNLDVTVFRLVNGTLANPVSDQVMPFLSGNPLVGPLVLVLLGWLLVRGGAQGRCYVVLLALTLAANDGLVVNRLKKLVDRPRPFNSLPDVHLLVGKGLAKSMPSSHAATAAAAAMVTGLYYRRTRKFLFPMAAAVGISRVAVGVHYPSDVLVGWALGLAGGWAWPKAFNGLWRFLGRRWFARWQAMLPMLLPDAAGRVSFQRLPPGDPAGGERLWRRSAYVLVGTLLCVRLAYVASGTIQLSEDEAYQWLWAKHPALSYYSKPPFIAYAQRLGTALFGDTQLGVRFFAPVIAALLGVMLFRFVASQLGAHSGFLFLVTVTAVPLLSVGSIIMTIDPLTVLFWTGAMLAGWTAIQRGRTQDWLLVGLCFAGGFLSKYISPLQWLSFALFFVLWPPARACLRTPGPWLAVGVNLLATIPVLIWNAQHGWITATHLKERGGLDQVWRPTLKFLGEFLGAEFGLLNPLFFLALIVALVRFWRHDWKRRAAEPESAQVRLYLFCHGGIVLGFYLLYTLKTRVHPNWIATGLLPLLLFTFFVGHDRWQAGALWPRRMLVTGIALGLPLIVLLHDTNLVGKLTQRGLPSELDPLMRVRGYDAAANLVAEQRDRLAAEGRPVFVITDHYGLCGLLTFYWPEARTRVTTDPLVTVISADRPQNQIWFWPHFRYADRKGQTALYLQNAKRPHPVPQRLREEFGSVTEVGTFDVEYRGRVAHRYQISVCRDKR